MFIRVKKTPRSQSISVQIVESFRLNGKMKQRVIRHVGTAQTEEKLTELKQLAEAIKVELIHEKLSQKSSSIHRSSAQFLGHLSVVSNKQTLLTAELEELERRVLGIHDIYGYVYDQIGFSNPFSRPQQRTFSAQVLKDIVLARIAQPTSKRASVALLQEQFGVNHALDHVYQMMDKIDDLFCEKIQRAALAATLKLTGEKLRLLFYDATTLYFESFNEDELKQNGYSKDMKFNQAQVLLALFVTEKGLPVGYELFPGAVFEGHTLIPVLEKLKHRYQLEEIIVVADRGLLSEKNLKHLEENKFRYVVGARIKNLSCALQNSILDEKNYKKMESDPRQKIAFFESEQRYLIVNYSLERANKDSYERQKTITKLQKKLSKSKDPKSLLNNYGYKKYIEMKGEASIGINEEKIKHDAKWDGLLGILTNIKDVSAEQVLAYYRSLWQIEACFRINKHDLKIRPIYHWTPQRIKAHVAISFMAFVCVKYLEYRVCVQSEKLSPEVIRQSLLNVQASIIREDKTGKEFLLPSKINSHAKEIYRIIHMKVPTKIMALKRNA